MICTAVNSILGLAPTLLFAISFGSFAVGLYRNLRRDS